MKKRYFIGVTLILWTAMLMFSLGAIAPVEALQIDLKEEIGKTTQASFEHKDRDVASKTTSVELFYQGPFYQRCDEEVYEKANLPEPSITTDETADLPTINDKFNSVLVLTLTSLEDLKADDSIPDKDWIDSLKPLTGQEFEGEESFWTAVSLEIGQPLIDQYGAQILAHARVRQADSKATSTVETTSVAQNQLHFEINLDDIIGNSYYNKTTTHPLNHDEDYARYSDPSHPDYDPDFVAKYFPGGFEEGDLFPDYSQVDNGDLAYYNNWEMTSADSYSYGGYGGDENTFSIDDGDDIADEQVWVTARYSYEYDLSGRWTYHTVTNTHQNDDPTDDVTYNERTGHFYTSFGSHLNIGNGDEQFEYDAFEDLWRNDMADIPDTEGLERVTQELSGEFTTEFSFLVTEGVEYQFDMFAGVYGYCDGFADYNSFGLATLDLIVQGDVVHTPEPATSLMLGIGVLALYWYRKRLHKR